VRRKPPYRVITFILLPLVIVESAMLIYLWASRPAKKKAARPAAIKGKIAIVIDDWGYNRDNLDIIEQVRYPFTASVLPGLDHTGPVAESLHRMGFEVILHLPMEPREKCRMEKDTILTSMSEKEIVDIIGRDLADLNYAVGVSNHMGSKATEDPKIMAIVFRELKKRRLFFLDSFVSSKSICSALAGKTGIGFAKRDIFLDNEEDPGYIKGQLAQLKKKARSRGYAVGIGHDRRNTLKVLSEMMPQMEKEGYKFVPVSELIK
jgi:hypothetical protein